LPVSNGLFDSRIYIGKISFHFRQLFRDGLALQALYDSTGKELASSISVHYEAVKEFNGETLCLIRSHQHGPVIIRIRAITERATASE
jgi:hypothetical protein